MTIFGDIWDPSLLEDDCTAFLKKWFRTYAAEISEQRGHGRDRYKVPAYWTTTPALTPDAIKQVRYPAVLVVSTGVTGIPRRDGRGKYEATYALGITILSTANEDVAAGRMAKRYGAAIRSILLQKPSMDTDYITEVAWVDERFTDFIGSEKQAVGSATEIFNVTVKEILNAKTAPPGPDPLPEPATAPGQTYGEVQTVRDHDTEPPYAPTTTTRLT